LNSALEEAKGLIASESAASDKDIFIYVHKKFQFRGCLVTLVPNSGASQLPGKSQSIQTQASAELNRAFVLMEYFGYLRRNPDDAPESTRDYTGYDFWLTKLVQINGNYINAEMVKAFLGSTEYRQRFGTP